MSNVIIFFVAGCFHSIKININVSEFLGELRRNLIIIITFVFIVEFKNVEFFQLNEWQNLFIFVNF